MLNLIFLLAILSRKIVLCLSLLGMVWPHRRLFFVKGHSVVYMVFFCGIVSTWVTPVWRHFACSFKKKNMGYCGKLGCVGRREGEIKKKICITKSTQLATLCSFFITVRAAVFTSVLQDRYSFFFPLCFDQHSPLSLFPSSLPQ